jgi:hypothetical protein
MRFAIPNVWRRRRWRLALGWSAGTLAVLGLAFVGYMKLVEGAWIRYNKWDKRERGSLGVGGQAPDLVLPLVDRGAVRLSELWRERPVVLIFGSCT